MSELSDSDCELQLTRVSSTKVHKLVPEDTDYRLIFKPAKNERVGLLYTLKAGQVLPYVPLLKGM